MKEVHRTRTSKARFFCRMLYETMETSILQQLLELMVVPLESKATSQGNQLC